MDPAVISFTNTGLGVKPAAGQGEAVLTLLPLERLASSLADHGQAALTDRYLLPLEQERYCAFSHAKRKLEWLGGRIAAKQAVHILRPGPGRRDRQIIADRHGRPFFSDRAGNILETPTLSISHSHGLAAALAVESGSCGLDIQKIVATIHRVRQRFTSPPEMTLIRRAEKKLTKEAGLTIIWAAKEALRKAAGITPLPGFLELRLTAAAPLPTSELLNPALALDFQAPPDQGSPDSPARVTAGLYHDFAVAFTFAS
ncbi:MAG: 4'-phosphopantetheinyl transferase superfamily protein [Desulfobacterales bacterium]|nr:4'-phosphopantetheinyl transferase superfamily protein [Desulfobacterales bacterium]